VVKEYLVKCNVSTSEYALYNPVFPLPDFPSFPRPQNIVERRKYSCVAEVTETGTRALEVWKNSFQEFYELWQNYVIMLLSKGTTLKEVVSVIQCKIDYSCVLNTFLELFEVI
jgi:hypothetical protein